MATPLFSVIIPVYNSESYLEQCISSVLDQEYQDYEIILVNDGSTDNSLNICLNYMKKYKNIFLITKPHTGVSEARNYGINIAKGEYILFLDNDDYWIGHSIFNDLDTLIKNHNLPDVVLHTFSALHNNKDLTRSSLDLSSLTGDYSIDFTLLQERAIYRSNCCLKIVKRTLTMNNPFPIGFLHEDSQYCFDLATRINSYAIYNSDFYVYRLRENSLSRNPNERNVRDLLAIIERGFYNLNEIKHQKPYLYLGLRNYLKQELCLVTDWINSLDNDFRLAIFSTHQRCVTLLNLYSS